MNQAATPSTPKIGIVGGGQLARMLMHAAREAGFPPLVYAQSREDSSTFVKHVSKERDFVFGALNDPGQLKTLFEKCDIVTFENEFIDINLFRSILGTVTETAKEAVTKTTTGTVQFIPRLEHLEITQDK